MERRLHAAVPTPMTFHSSNDGTRFNLPPAPPSAFNIKLPAGTAAPPAAQVLGDVPACRSPLPQQPGHTAATSFNAFLNGAFAESLGDARNVGGGFGGVGGVGDIIGGGGGGGVRGGGGFVLGEVADAPLRQLIEAKERELHEIHDFRLRYGVIRNHTTFCCCKPWLGGGGCAFNASVSLGLICGRFRRRTTVPRTIDLLQVHTVSIP